MNIRSLKSTVVNLNLLLFLLVLLNSCKREENEDPIALPDQTIFKEVKYNGESSIDPFSQISIVFNFQIDSNKYFVYNSFKPIKPKLDSYSVRCNGNTISGDTTWSEFKDTLFFVPDLPYIPGSSISLELKMHWEILKDEIWEPYTENGIAVFENKELIITVAGLPDYLVEEDIEVSYPLVNQYHYLKNEYNKGIIKLKRDRRDLFTAPVFTANDALKVKVSNSDGYSYTTSVIYDVNKKMAEFNMPQDLENEKIYKIELYKENTSTAIKTIYLSYHFRTSQFNTFTEKFDAIFTSTLRMWFWQDMPDVYDLYLSFDANENEQLDYYESHMGTVIDLEFLPEGNEWFEECKSIYTFAESKGYTFSRPAEPCGIPPVHGFRVVADDVCLNNILTEAQIESGIASRVFSDNQFSLVFEGSYYIDMDLYDLKTKIINTNFGHLTPEEITMTDYNAPVPSAGYYNFSLNYIIPGTGIITTRKYITGSFLL